MNHWEFRILHPNSTHLPVPSYPLSPLQCSLLPKKQTKTKWTKTKRVYLNFCYTMWHLKNFSFSFQSKYNLSYFPFRIYKVKYFQHIASQGQFFSAVNFFCPKLLAIYLHYILQDNYLILCLQTLYFILNSRACVLIQNTYCYTPVEQVKWSKLTIDKRHLT